MSPATHEERAAMYVATIYTETFFFSTHLPEMPSGQCGHHDMHNQPPFPMNIDVTPYMTLEITNTDAGVK